MKKSCQTNVLVKCEIYTISLKAVPHFTKISSIVSVESCSPGKMFRENVEQYTITAEIYKHTSDITGADLGNFENEVTVYPCLWHLGTSELPKLCHVFVGILISQVFTQTCKSRQTRDTRIRGFTPSTSVSRLDINRPIWRKQFYFSSICAC